MAKQKRKRKSTSERIDEQSGAIGAIFNDINLTKQHLVGMENLIFHLSDFLGKKEEFVEYLNNLFEDKEESKGEKKEEKK